MSQTTERALAASLKKLLSCRTLDKITVKDIVEDCGVNRQTFYYHFQDIYALIEWIFLDDAERLLDGKKSYEQWQTCFFEIFEYLKENKDFVINAYNSISRENLEKYLKKWLRPMMTDVINSQPNAMKVTQEDRNFIIDIYIYAAVGITFQWVGNGMTSNYEDDIDKLTCLLEGTTEYLLSKFIKK